MPLLKFKCVAVDRLDRVVAAGAGEVGVSRRLAKTLVDAGRVKVDGHVIKRASSEIQVGATLHVDYDEISREDHVKLDGSIIFQDEWVLVINKPSGLPSQATPDPDRDHAGAAAERYLKATLNKPTRVAIHHRLDSDTSGVLIMGIHKDANKGLTNAFRDRRAQKTYLALVLGPFPESVLVENHLAPIKSGKRMAMHEVQSGGDYARTQFTLRESYGDICLVEARPTTGRMHQIRVHLAGLGHPILGDSLYGGERAVKGKRIKRTLLHAWKLELPHPVKRDSLSLEAPLPSDFEALTT